MDDWIVHAETICLRCGGACCHDAHPPVSASCYERLRKAGVPADSFESAGYTRLKTKENGECILIRDGKCSIHAFKPETCRAGPFTFDVKDTVIEIYLKRETICPLIPLLKGNPDAYGQLYGQAERSILHLVKHLTGDEIAEICRIEEPETDLVAVLSKEAGRAV